MRSWLVGFIGEMAVNAARARAVLALLCALTLCIARTEAQSVSVDASVANENVTVGDSARLTITVSGSRTPQRPELPAVPGLDIRYLSEQDSSSQYLSIVNGRREERVTLEYSFFYEVTPKSAGEYEIPAIEVNVGSGVLTTRPLRLRATAPAEMENYKLRISCEDSAGYVGESFAVTLTWYIGGNPTTASFRLADENAPFDIQPAPPAPTGQNEKALEMLVDGVPVIGVLGTGMLDGRTYTTLTLRLRVVPRASGELMLGPATCRFEVETRRTTSRWDDPLFGSSRTTKHVIPSNELMFSVEPLPTQGRPKDFSGLVGKYGLSARADATRVAVGDPIALSLVITGPGPLEKDIAPSLEAVPTIAGNFRLSPEGWTSATAQPAGALVVNTVLRAAHDRVSEIPPIGITYFDPELGEYRLAQTEPIPLRVLPSAVVTSAAPVNPGVSGAPRSPIVSAAAGLPANRTGPGVLRDSSPFTLTLVGAASSPVFMLTLAGPAVAWAAVALSLAYRRRRDPAMVRLSWAERRACAKAGNPGDALREFVAGVVQMQPDAVTSEDAQRALAGVDPDIARAFTDAIQGIENSGYGNDAAHAGSGAEQRIDARRLIRDAARAIRRAPRSLLIALCAAWLAFSSAPVARAQDDSPPAEINDAAATLEAADRWFESALAESDTERARSLFAAAGSAYAGIADSGVRSPGLYLNSGNSYFLAGDMGQAVLAYRRGMDLAPTDKQLSAALAHARSSLALAAPTEARSTWRTWPLLWRSYVTSRTLIVIAGVLWAFGWSLAVVRLFRRAARVAAPAATSMVIAAALTALVAYESHVMRTAESAVVTSDARALQGPALGVYDPAFEQPLPPGLEVQILERRDDWVRVRLGDSREGWIPENAMQRV